MGKAWFTRQPIRLPFTHEETQKIVDNLSFQGECWIWVGKIGSAGYGKITIQGLSRTAHVVSYLRFSGERDIPENMVLDHTCGIRSCVNPAHLEPVTQLENVRRGKASVVRATHCPRGHEYNQENAYVYRKMINGRERVIYQCKICLAKRCKDHRDECNESLRSRRDRLNGLTVAPVDWKAQKTHCRNGHEYTEENTYWWRGGRQCRVCRKIHWLRSYDKKMKSVLVMPEEASA